MDEAGVVPEELDDGGGAKLIKSLAQSVAYRLTISMLPP